MNDEQSRVTDETTQEGISEEQAQDQVQDHAEEQAVFEINGEQVTLDELKQGYMRQGDYTRKTQELAEAKRNIARSPEYAAPQQAKQPENDEVSKAVELLKQHGVVTKQDLEALKAQQEDEKDLQNLLSEQPELRKYEQAMRQIGKVDNRAWIDIATSYEFTTKDKLAKAKTSRPIGQKIVPGQEAPSPGIMDLSDQEWQAWKAKNITGSGRFKKK